MFVKPVFLKHRLIERVVSNWNRLCIIVGGLMCSVPLNWWQAALSLASSINRPTAYRSALKSYKTKSFFQLRVPGFIIQSIKFESRYCALPFTQGTQVFVSRVMVGVSSVLSLTKHHWTGERVAQRVSAAVCHTGGREFEPHRGLLMEYI